MKIKDLFTILKDFFGIVKTSVMCKIDPKNELKYRKKISKQVVKDAIKEVIVEGELDKSAQILIGNHVEDLDIPLMESVIDEKLIWVAKKELGEIPVVKWMLTETEMILIDRKDKRSIIQMIKEIKERLSRGLKVVIFPEGTRNRGNPWKLQPFKKGTKAVVEKLNAKVQPFVIVGIKGAVENFELKKPTVKVIFLESFYPYEGWYEEVRNRMQKVLDEERKNYEV